MSELDPILKNIETDDTHRQAGSDWWLIWNLALLIVGIAALIHWLDMGKSGFLSPLLQTVVDAYADKIGGFWEGVAKLSVTKVPAWLPDYLTFAFLFAMVSLRATAPSGAGENWPIWGKVTDWLFHFALWPLIAAFYTLSLLGIAELVDRERLNAVRTTLIAFLAIVPVTLAILWLNAAI